MCFRSKASWTSTFVFLICLSLSSISAGTPLKVVRVHNSIEAYLGHSFIKKCIGANDLPDVTTPVIDVTEDKENSSRLYHIQFNGKNLNPLLRMNPRKIALEKTTDKSGYFITLSKSLNEKKFQLLFELHNEKNDSIIHVLQINDTNAKLSALLTQEQKQRYCVRDQLWLGAGLPFISTKQHNVELDADIESSATSKEPALSFEYRKTLNTNVALNLSYRSKQTKINTDGVNAPADDRQKWQAFDGSFILRNINFSKQTTNSLIFPYLKIGYQQQIVSVYHLSSGGTAHPVNLTGQSAVFGAGLHVFSTNGYLVEGGLTTKWLLSKNGGIEKSESAFDGYIGASKVVHKNLSLGLNLTATTEKLKYKTTVDGYTNTGSMDYTFTTIDLRLGWVF